ncbi:hypothetical protein K1719_038611 [Acacia pycnantha]|nr:hypothetical protein K1719_038611 [Acacia pycnantha]
MASTLGKSSIANWPQYLHSHSHKHLIYSLSLPPGQNFGRKFYGGIGIHGMKGRSQFSVASVATHVNFVEQQVGNNIHFWD